MKVCPICTLVSGSWIALLAYRAAGNAVDPALIAALMGGSAVGIAYTLVRRLPTHRSPALFKLLTIPPLLAVAYGVAAERWPIAALGLLVGTIVASLFFLNTGHVSERMVREVEKKLEHCCDE